MPTPSRPDRPIRRRRGSIVGLGAALLALLVLLVAAGCEQAAELVGAPATFPGAPAAVQAREALPSCGSEDLASDAGPNLEARTCLWTAWQESRPAEFVSTMTTMEGDPVTFIWRVRPGAVEILVDSTQDRWGSGTWTRQRCPELVIDAENPVQPSFATGGECTEETLR